MSIKDLYAYYIVSPVKSHTTVPAIAHRDQLGTGFSSLYAVTKESAEAIIKAGTTAGFKGSVWSERLWIDIDSYDKADAVEQRLKSMGVDFVAFDSGGRGVHFGVLRSADASHLLPHTDKQWVREHFPEADLSIYTHLHLFRLAGSLHETGGRNKRLVTEQRGSLLITPPLVRGINATNKASDISYSSTGLPVFNCFRVMSNSVPTTVGNRHPTYVKLVHALRDDAKVSISLARWWLGEVNRMSQEPKDDDSLDQIVKSIYGEAA